jgi:protein arginine kinase
MIVDSLVRNPGAWLSQGRETDIVISSRVRLARNVRDMAFPSWAGEEERVRLWNEMRAAFGKLPDFPNPLVVDMGSVSALDKEVLRERHLASSELVEKGRGSGLIVSEDERLSVMVNEEDHLRLQAISPGMNLRGIWERLDALDTAMEQHVEYAFSERLGYLTACPTNVGTGLRAGVMAHLAGLGLMNEADSVARGLNRLGYEVRGVFGEGSEAAGSMYQISNRLTLGEREEDTIRGMEEIAAEVVGHERNARRRLLGQRRVCVLDHVGRAYGLLRHARVLSSSEAIHLLSALRLGVDFGLAAGVTAAQINRAMLLTQPGHLQKMLGRGLTPEERDEVRADTLRKHLAGVTLTE